MPLYACLYVFFFEKELPSICLFYLNNFQDKKDMIIEANVANNMMIIYELIY